MFDYERFLAIVTGMPTQTMLPSVKQKTEHKCLLPGCEEMTTHNGGYCCADHCEEHRRMLREVKR